ncbi:hypothetical protein D3C72_1865550 [compost metagenome]
MLVGLPGRHGLAREVLLSEHFLLQLVHLVAPVEIVHFHAQPAQRVAAVFLVRGMDGRQHLAQRTVVVQMALELGDMGHQVLQLGEVVRGRE